MTAKMSVRIPHELATWIDVEAERRKCDRSAVINDALRLAATAGEVRQATQLVEDLTPLLISKFDQLTGYIKSVHKMAGQAAISGNAIAQHHGLYDHVKTAYRDWLGKNE